MKKEIVEINGIKFEVDLSMAKVITEYQIGSKVNVLLEKDYNGKREVVPGVICGFNNFQSLPTITICYLHVSYSDVRLNFLQFNSNTTGIEIAPCQESDIIFNKSDILAKMDREIIKKQEEVKDLEMKKEYFIKNFQKHFDITEQESYKA